MKKVGILMPIFSLPNDYGIGSIGKNAFAFIDFLSQAKQDYWQVLPCNPTSYGDSPYQAFSTFAYNPYFIDVEDLLSDKLITLDDLNHAHLKNDSNHIDYGCLFENKIKLLKKAYLKADLFKDEFEKFKMQNDFVFDYAMFMVLKETHYYQSWNHFEEKYKKRDSQALKEFYQAHQDDVEAYMFMQFLYERQWLKLKAYANKKHVQIIGDMPIYVSYDSVDVWVNPQLFLLDENLNPTKVAGVPPDYFSKTGQLWGNPLYNYEKMEKDHFAWWVKRIAHALRQFDLLRIDHFRGFSAFYAIDFNKENAIDGVWLKGPKMKLFQQVNETLNHPQIIAENLGLLDDEVIDLLKKCDYPGMRVLQFEMYSLENILKLKQASSQNVLYPGTHDNEPFYSWLKNHASKEEKENTMKELNISDLSSLSDALISYCYRFPFNYCIISMQDVLMLDESARINTPGSQSGNWTYQFKKEMFTQEVAKKLSFYKDRYILKKKETK